MIIYLIILRVLLCGLGNNLCHCLCNFSCLPGVPAPGSFNLNHLLIKKASVKWDIGFPTGLASLSQNGFGPLNQNFMGRPCILHIMGLYG